MMESRPPHSQSGRDSGGIAWGRFPLVLAISAVSVMVWLVGSAPTEYYPFAGWMVLQTGGRTFPFQELLFHSLFYDRWLHLFLTLLALVTCGRSLEMRWGTLRFGIFYLLVTSGSAGIALLVSWIMSRLQDGWFERAWIFGGAAAALASMAAYSMVEEDRMLLQIFSRRFLIWALIILGGAGLMVLEQAGLSHRDQHSKVFLLPQISGLFLGWVYVHLLPHAASLLARWRRHRQEAERDKVFHIRLRVDQLLDKISRQGRQSLSAEEEAFLKQASKHYKRQL
ncbi:MAG: rhomboid family intramembrane serine protease [Planctomycetes bacterium]|nr:rhomboid family intramembrane serine protease [Planctomycetota bacterium]